MGLLCLSLAATLRCAGIPNTQSIVLLVPPAIEALQSLFLIRTVWRNGRQRWLLVAEAWMFLVLAILDYVSHATVRGMGSLGVFEPMDKAIGVLSGIPILTYTSFLFLLTRSDILPLIAPDTLRTLFQFGLFSLIPPTLMSHELGSLVGVSYRINTTTLVPETGFLNLTTRSLSFAFTTSAVVCLASFQLLIFLVCTWRISQAWDRASEPVFVDVTRPRSGSRSTGASYLGEEPGIRGLTWLTLALALGATETLLSLGSQSFVLVLVRRVLRVFARGSLMYALVRGSSDGFSNLEAGRPDPPRPSTLIQHTPIAPVFYTQRPMNPFADPSTPHSRVTVMYDQKSAPVLQMRFSGLDVDSTQFRNRSGSTVTSIVGHAGHSTRSVLPRSRTLSEKRSARPLTSIQVPDRAFMAGVFATQSPASTRSSLPLGPPSQSRLALGSLNSSQLDLSTLSHMNHSASRSSEEPGSYERTHSLDGVRELTNQFPVIPPRAALRRALTQLAYAVEEEDEPGSSQRASEGSSRSQSRHARTHTADSNVSALTTASSMARRKPVPAHTPGGTLLDLPSTNRSNSGEQVVVDTHRALFPQPRLYEYTSSRASSDETDTLTATATGTPSPAEILTRRVERARLSGAEEHTWMMRASLPIGQSAVVSRTPEVFDSADYESSRVEWEGVASPKSAWSAQARSRRSTLAPGANVQGWGRKLSDTDPSQVPGHLRPGGESSRRHESGSFVGDEPHAM
ncbi:unnamed protein product [Rhizoctonia solani]|uniref:Transmembrane protein n=2 Tax=Rhizoctonia solani TaxID=456999 RepID=A0A8H3CXA6_9AGAM|nr:transmembrane protein, putative [Rhizoctonia solani AG-3 Rhs1AP]CAE6382466.1 unnamed protein product [Rhizoctonia solani]CAE6497585.1 unnamed protein product [Rhizoctonia solani]